MEENDEETSIIEALGDAGIYLSEKDKKYIYYSFMFGMLRPNSLIKRINYIPKILERLIPDPDFTRDAIVDFLYKIELITRASRKLLESNELNLIRELQDMLINTINEVRGDGKINKDNLEILKKRLGEEFEKLINRLETSSDPNILEGLQILKQLGEENIVDELEE